MNAIQKAISDARFRIPPQILDRVFGRHRYMDTFSIVSVDTQIENLVIRPKVLVDCNLVGGREIIINVDSNEVKTMYIGQTQQEVVHIITISKEKTQGRSIIVPLAIDTPSLAFSNHTLGYSNYTGSQPNMTELIGQNMLNSATNTPITGNHRLEIIAENVISARGNFILPIPFVLRAIIDNDENLSNINPRSYVAFSELCTYAIKAYIYNTYLIEMDEAELHAGQELGTFKSIIEGYSDAYENYETVLMDKWRKIAFMNDHVGFERFLGGLFGGFR